MGKIRGWKGDKFFINNKLFAEVFVYKSDVIPGNWAAIRKSNFLGTAGSHLHKTQKEALKAKTNWKKKLSIEIFKEKY